MTGAKEKQKGGSMKPRFFISARFAPADLARHLTCH
jgi:hypothetical protein